MNGKGRGVGYEGYEHGIGIMWACMAVHSHAKGGKHGFYDG